MPKSRSIQRKTFSKSKTLNAVTVQSYTSPHTEESATSPQSTPSAPIVHVLYLALLPLSHSRILSRSLLILRHPQPRINSRAERREAYASNSSRLWAGVLRQDGTRQAPRRNAVGQIVLRPEPFYSALDAREEGADFAEVLGRAIGSRAHVFEAVRELSSERERGYGRLLAAGCCCLEGRIVGHLVKRKDMVREGKLMSVIWERMGLLLTDAMNMPNMPPRPKPATPAMAVLTKHDSIILLS